MEKLFIDKWFKMPPKEQNDKVYVIKKSERKAGLKYVKSRKKTKKATRKTRG